VINQISVHLDAGILVGKPPNDIGQKREPRRLHAADPHFSCGRIGQEFDIPDGLLQLIEYRNAAFEERATVDRRLDAAGAAIEKPHAERVFEIGDDLGDGGVGNTEVPRRLGHAAVLNDRRDDMQVPQFQPAADLTLPVDLSQH
jgi:hypothetical protein